MVNIFINYILSLKHPALYKNVDQESSIIFVMFIMYSYKLNIS